MADITKPGVSFGPSDRFICVRGGYVLLAAEGACTVSGQAPGATAATGVGDDGILAAAGQVLVGPVPGGYALSISASTAVAHVVRQPG